MSFKEKNSQLTAILLAAGGSRRLGQPKQLILFKNELLINYILKQIRDGGIKDIKVVLGSHFKEIKSQIIFDDVTVLENQKWEEGMSSSIKCGLMDVSLETRAVMFFIVDQPFIHSTLIKDMVEKYRNLRRESHRCLCIRSDYTPGFI